MSSELLTGVPVVLNTSFNVKGEPIVCSPDDAVRCFLNTGLDYLVLGNYHLHPVMRPAFSIEGRRPDSATST